MTPAAIDGGAFSATIAYSFDFFITYKHVSIMSERQVLCKFIDEIFWCGRFIIYIHYFVEF